MSLATAPIQSRPHVKRQQPASAPRVIVLVYSATAYLAFLVILGYAVGFFAGFAVPKGIDQGTHVTAPVAAGIDLLLLLLFAVQHTVMARRSSYRARVPALIPHAWLWHSSPEAGRRVATRRAARDPVSFLWSRTCGDRPERPEA